jgi:hypothetical protein
MEVIFVALIFIAVITLAGVLFVLWVARAIVGVILRAIWPSARPRAINAEAQPCGHDDCRCNNPNFARFCRRCGRPLPALMRLAETHAA